MKCARAASPPSASAYTRGKRKCAGFCYVIRAVATIARVLARVQASRSEQVYRRQDCAIRGQYNRKERGADPALLSALIDALRAKQEAIQKAKQRLPAVAVGG